MYWESRQESVTFNGTAAKKLQALSLETGLTVPEILSDALNLARIYHTTQAMFVDLPNGSIAKVVRKPSGGVWVEPVTGSLDSGEMED